jgi:hypothetical protein
VGEIVPLMAEVDAFGTLHVDRLSKVRDEVDEKFLKRQYEDIHHCKK